MKIKRKAQGGAGADEKAKVSANDTTANFLKNKFVAGTGVTIEEQNDGGNETLKINATGGTPLDEQVVFFVQLFS